LGFLLGSATTAAFNLTIAGFSLWPAIRRAVPSAVSRSASRRAISLAARFGIVSPPSPISRTARISLAISAAPRFAATLFTPFAAALLTIATFRSLACRPHHGLANATHQRLDLTLGWFDDRSGFRFRRHLHAQLTRHVGPIRRTARPGAGSRFRGRWRRNFRRMRQLSGLRLGRGLNA
jgi:hypothetical protein